MLTNIRDETATGGVLRSMLIDLPDTVTLRELIRLRVREEVARHNARPVGRLPGPVRPTATEEELNGCRSATSTPVDWERQADAAVRAFTHNGFFVLVGDRQVEQLDEPLTLDEAADVVFVRLVQLVGG